jgi:hydroxymethylglutaryl-CoA lyase
VPQLADNTVVLAGIARQPGVRYAVLTPNLKGLEAALPCKPDEIVVFGAASEAFSRRNINCGIEESIERFRPVVVAAHAQGIKVRAAISCALGCPYQGEVSADDVERVVRLMKGIGVDHCGVADTIGVGTPRRAQAALERALKHYPVAQVSGHFHDTYGQALANIYACLELGVHTFDASVAGLGGCPYAKGATGNVATEDVLFMLRGLGIATGVDLDALVDAAKFISDALGRKPVSRSGNALLAKRAQAAA